MVQISGCITTEDNFHPQMTRSNPADNCNFMDNQFRMYISHHPVVSLFNACFSGEQHWRSAL
ncbi:hypothetical protein ABK730_14665 [Klebsiella indica]|uniref:hypothetical protein n=1 Tax=Klebsiella TaxID=570 RepID=UPI001F4F948D|nr:MULTISPECIES: hypothetical protein [Klebsiella]